MHNIQITDTVLLILILSLAVQLFYYLFFYSAVGFSRSRQKRNTLTPVSVIICARNEEENIKKFLPAVLTQDYPDYEVIVVNDASTDDTERVLAEYTRQYSRLRVSTIKKDEKFTHGKKLAVLVGVKAAKNEWLLFTDADCKPASDQWIRTMARNFTQKTSIVLGYGGYLHRRGLFNNFIRYETFFIALQYLGIARRGKPYMGVGRNLAYRKPLYFRISKEKHFNRILSGDDDLLVNMLGNSTNTLTELDARAHTRSEPPRNWKEWFNNKKRHTTTARYYSFRSKCFLGGELSARILFYLSATAMFFLSEELLFPAGAIALRWIIMLIILSAGRKRLKEKHLLLSSLLYDIISPFFYFLIWLSNLSRTSDVQWR